MDYDDDDHAAREFKAERERQIRKDEQYARRVEAEMNPQGVIVQQ